jgi:hypothetical protein
MLNRVFQLFIVINNQKTNYSQKKDKQSKKNVSLHFISKITFITNNEQPFFKEYHFLIIYQSVSETFLDSRR